ncbi:succinylglutamate desuccinylase [Trinickia dinghuensis]|uniref:Succinylglutamate desuccinylase n=1 Tax=Trinickia dinghuensis TaxID=2291023 RepID=A0A3D8JWL1_9BURK|nr:succinylglutamate desuccinylase [Trinickia dinghuensis]RDU97006.1 succinylglutamate desuccinylase [Trinickia dinghuensis]
MTSSAETSMPAMLADFLAFTLAGLRPSMGDAGGECAGGVRYQWLEDGVIEFTPASAARPQANPLRSVLVSAGVHGDETAPIELLSRMVADIARGEVPLASRVGIVLGNVAAMRAGGRYVDDDLNRLFCGRYKQLQESSEAPRARILEAVAKHFFSRADDADHSRWHIDMHTAIRASVFERFALLPHTGRVPSLAMFQWLADARIEAVLLHTAKGNTYTHFTAESFGANACTLELGKVRPFGENDLARFSGADAAVRSLISGAPLSDDVPMPRVFTVIGQITKQSDAFELHMADDVANFTPFQKGTVLASDGDYRYAVTHDEERIIFPNRTVKPGLRAGLTVVETTGETIAELAP